MFITTWEEYMPEFRLHYDPRNAPAPMRPAAIWAVIIMVIATLILFAISLAVEKRGNDPPQLISQVRTLVLNPDAVIVNKFVPRH